MSSKTNTALFIALSLSGLAHAAFLLKYDVDILPSSGGVFPQATVSVQLTPKENGFSKNIDTDIKNKEKKESLSNQQKANRLEAINEDVPAPIKKSEYVEVVNILEDKVEAEELPELLMLEKNDDVNEELLQLVYLEINKHKHYPYQAKRQRREGKVKINFTLHPDGQVTEIEVIKSSRLSVLDRAAQQAVESISPFLIASNYLQTETELNVNIDYRLN
jgi:TonB family protein